MSTEALREMFGAIEPLKFSFPVSSPGIESVQHTSTTVEVQYSDDLTGNMIAPFSGRLQYTPENKVLTLVADPATVLHMYTVYGDEDFIPKNLKWCGVDINSVIQKFGASTNNIDFEEWSEKFITGEVGGNVECGDEIGDFDGTGAVFQFCEDDETFINPLYSLWKFRKLFIEGVISSNEEFDIFENHIIIEALSLPSRELEKIDNNIFQEGGDEIIGSYRSFYANS